MIKSTYDDTDTANEEGEGQAAPVVRPSALSYRVTGPRIGRLCPHTVHEEEEYAEVDDEGNELEDQSEEEDLV